MQVARKVVLTFFKHFPIEKRMNLILGFFTSFC